MSIVPKLEDLITDAIQNLDDEEIKTQLSAGISKIYNEPPIKETELVIRKHLDLEQMRKLLFRPSDQDLEEFYPLLMRSAPPAAPADHPLNKTLKTFISCFYLVHIKNWSSVESFIVAGNGLVVLSDLFVHENIYIRSQAIDCFLQITSSSSFDWFAEQPSPPNKTSRQFKLRQKMYELAGTKFVFNLLHNYRQKNNFPGASFYCLQILAFWLSWIRYFFTKDRKLNLSIEILNALREWGRRTDLPKEEVELAQKLYDDFSREPPVEQMEQVLKQEAEKMEKSSLNQEDNNNNSISELEKNRGNEFFKQGKYSEAIECYSKAISSWNSSEKIPATFFTNRAVSYFKRNSKETNDLHKALLDCDRAIQLDPNFAKAYFRKAQILDQMGFLEDAIECAVFAKSISDDKSIAELADSLFEKQRKLIALTKKKNNEINNENERIMSSPKSLIQEIVSESTSVEKTEETTSSSMNGEEKESDPIQVFLSSSNNNKQQQKKKKPLIQEI